LLQKAETAAQHAIKLDGSNIDGIVAQAITNQIRGRFIQAEDLLKQALSSDPGSAEALAQYSLLLANVGRLRDALTVRLRLRAQEPLVPVFNRFTALLLWLNGRNDEAVNILKEMRPEPIARFYLAHIYASTGRYDEAIKALQQIPPGAAFESGVTESIRMLQAAAKGAVPSPRNGATLGFDYLYRGGFDRMLSFYDGFAAAGYPSVGSFPTMFWSPRYEPLRRTEGLKSFLRKGGFVDYWKARGWPDLCHPTTGDDFECN
jgi:thioredoxin-like negative regulator of GroEL